MIGIPDVRDVTCGEVVIADFPPPSVGVDQVVSSLCS